MNLIKNCIKITLPIFFGYITLSIAFGLILVENYPWWLAPVMSLFMYAGAAQFISIGLFAAGPPLVAILITMALVNLRHIVYGLSLIGKFKGCGKWRPYLIFGLTDETYSLLTTVDVPSGVETGRFYGTIALLNQFYWVAGSLIGALVGKFLPFDMAGADFALTALFVVLTIEQIMKSRQWGPVIVGFVCTIGAVLLWKFGVIGNSSNILMISLAAGLAGLFLIKERELRNQLVKDKTPIEDKITNERANTQGGQK